jgi:hypothetical protein
MIYSLTTIASLPKITINSGVEGRINKSRASPLKRKRIQSREVRLVATGEAFLEPEHLFTPFFATSRVGFGICDTQLRYQAINSALAATNQRPAEAHLGSTVRDVMGEVATEIESVFERVLDTQKPVLKEISGKIPTREDTVHWIANYFPVKDSGGKVRGLGAIVVEITEQKALETSLRLLGQKLLRTKKRQQRMVNELHASVIRYHAALKTNLSRLVRPIWQPVDRAELLAQSVELLEHFPVIPLRSTITARNIFQQIEQDPKLREGFFARIASDPQLQHEMLQALSKHPQLQNDLIGELAKTLNFRRWLLKIAGQGI